MGGRGAASNKSGAAFKAFKQAGTKFDEIGNIDKRALNEVLDGVKEVLEDFGLPLSTVTSVYSSQRGVFKGDRNANMGVNGFNQLSLTSNIYSSYDNAVKSNMSSKGEFTANGIKGTARHEAGHIVMNAIYKRAGYESNLKRAEARIKGKEEKAILKQAKKIYGSNPPISKYGSTSHIEKIAEAVSDVYSNKRNAHPYSKVIVDVMKKRLK